ncbi:hypothetical protein QWJ34_24930 [Saccharibacillus sp. CPCC 101409]|uniref:hypothetical protein n=1 Tax=Saccharibacillus sp. CPCC 101409 TaxID=3058041 RepID=UPI002671EE4B|nr:hypothetical protein [Saccharibacillus sp. CPCC 101409]MDO3413032.1 hypothetical protein [Saccharibacillus sp. CPCC 101409]
MRRRAESKRTVFGKRKTALAAGVFGASLLLASCSAIAAQNIPSAGSGSAGLGAGMGGGANGGGFGGMNAGPGRNSDRGGADGPAGGDGGFGGTGGRNFGGRGGDASADGGSAMREAMDADLIGRVVSADEGAVTLELVEQASDAGDRAERSPGGASADATGWTATGETVTLSLGSDAEISSDTGETQTPGTGGDVGPSSETGETRTPDNGDDVGTSSGTGETQTPGTGDDVEPSSETGESPDTNSSPALTAADLKAGDIVMVWYQENTEQVKRLRIL